MIKGQTKTKSRLQVFPTVYGLSDPGEGCRTLGKAVGGQDGESFGQPGPICPRPCDRCGVAGLSNE